MEALKNIKFDIDRIILQLFIPGLFAVIPFFFFFLNTFEGAKEYIYKYEGMCTSILIILSLTAGMIIEDLGSLLETTIDKYNQKKYKPKKNTDTPSRSYIEEWDNYLKLNKSENAHNQIRLIVVRLKFELSFCISLIFAIIGLFVLNIQISFIDNWFKYSIICIVLPLIISLYLLWEAFNSTKLLINLRKLILDNYEEQKNQPTP